MDLNAECEEPVLGLGQVLPGEPEGARDTKHEGD
jgi:hypothetical protein